MASVADQQSIHFLKDKEVNASIGKIVRKALGLQLLTMGFLLFCDTAWASTSCSVGGSSYTITVPASFNIRSDTAASTQVGGWITTETTGNAVCSFTGVGEATGFGGRPSGLTSLGKTWVNGGVTYTLYDSGVSGIGMAVKAVVKTNCGTFSYAVSPTGNLPGTLTQGYTGTICGGTGAATITSNLYFQIAFVTTVSPFTASGKTITGKILEASALFQGSTSGNDTRPWYTGVSSFSITPIAIIPGTCTTPDVVVRMGTHLRSEMPSVGTSTTPVDFSIGLTGCPAGINAFTYRIDPVVTAADAANSVLALDSTSSATGIGVQLLTDAGSPLPLAAVQRMELSTVSKAASSYAIPLKARYYRTGDMMPGSANTSVQFTIAYE